MKTLRLDVSGSLHEATHIRLYPAAEINQWRALVQQAQVQMGGVSTGLGFIGDPAWVIGGAIVSGLLTSGLTSAAQKAGVDNLTKAAALMDQIRTAGRLFAIEDIDGIRLPNPKAWIGMTKGEQKIDVNADGFMGRGAILRQHNKTKADVDRAGFITIHIDVPFIATDDEFVTICTGDDEVQVRWSAVTAMQVISA